jgi:hypothetical protein
MAISTILSIISALLAIVKYVVSYMNEQRWIDQGEANVILNSMKDGDDAVTRAQAIRQTTRLGNQRNPASVLRDDDGFKRSDD